MMKKYAALFIAVAAIAYVNSYAGSDAFEACFKKCMRTVNDKDKCDNICGHL